MDRAFSKTMSSWVIQANMPKLYKEVECHTFHGSYFTNLAKCSRVDCKLKFIICAPTAANGQLRDMILCGMHRHISKVSPQRRVYTVSLNKTKELTVRRSLSLDPLKVDLQEIDDHLFELAAIKITQDREASKWIGIVWG